MIAKTFSTLLFISILQLSCSGTPFWLPPAHRIPVQQGDLLEQEEINALVIGMTREQVLRLLGTPVMDNLFENNRWDYVYSQGLAGDHVKTKNLIVYFTDDKVSSINNQY